MKYEELLLVRGDVDWGQQEAENASISLNLTGRVPGRVMDLQGQDRPNEPRIDISANVFLSKGDLIILGIAFLDS